MRKLGYATIVASRFSEIDMYREVARNWQGKWNFSNTFRVTDGDAGRPDRIAIMAYGPENAHLWWVILLANNIQDPFNDIRTGTEILVPALVLAEQFVEECRQDAVSRGRAVNADMTKGWMVL